jgi:serine phosphatase RsbU (regulator of sigma subunit)
MDYAGYFRGGDGNILVLRKGGSGASGRDAAGELKARSGDANKLAESERVIEDLVEERVNRRLMRHELEIANGIQRSLLPEALPRLAGFSLAGYCRSAHAVGGDFYDVLPVGAEAHLLVVADVMGKGIPAALFAVILRSVLRASPELMDQPAALLTRVNRLLFSELSGVDMFITAQLVFLNAQKRRMITASAGHCPLAVADVREVRMFSPEGMPLGIFPDATFLDETVELPEDCRVLLYTDGVTDAMNARREPFGQERLLNWLRRRPAWPRTAEELKEDLAQALNTHQLDAGLADDQTFLIMAAG